MMTLDYLTEFWRGLAEGEVIRGLQFLVHLSQSLSYPDTLVTVLSQILPKLPIYSSPFVVYMALSAGEGKKKDKKFKIRDEIWIKPVAWSRIRAAASVLRKLHRESRPQRPFQSEDPWP